MAGSPIEEFTAPGFLEGMTSWSMEDLRVKRAHAVEVETGLSYLRRLVHGQLDIVRAERRRRDAGEEAGDLADLVERLPEILGEHVHAPGLGRLPSLMAPGSEALGESSRVDSIVSSEQLSHLPDASDEDLHQMMERLEQLDDEVSGQRRAMFDVIDKLHAEIVRRYRSGEATVDGLLE